MRTALKSAALCIAVLAMTLRAALPDGWMPSTQAGAAPIMLCPGMNDMAAIPATAGMKHNTAPQKPSHDQNHNGGTLCTFAAAAQLASSTNTPVLAPAPHTITIALTVSRDAPPSVPSHRANAARAPPVPV